MTRYQQSRHLIACSFTVLKQHPRLLLFPLFSSLALLMTLLGCLASVVSMPGAWQLLRQLGPYGSTLGAFVGYLVLYFISFFFQAALMASVLAGVNNGTVSLRKGLRDAAARWPALLGYALLNATVGMILRTASERVRLLGWIGLRLLGIAWSLASFLTIPVLIEQRVGPINAMKQSLQLFRRNWGENAIAYSGMMFLGLLQVGVVCLGGWLVYMALKAHTMVLEAVLGSMIAFLLLGLLRVTLNGIYTVALYQYATGRQTLAAFQPVAFGTIFRRR